MKGKGGKGEREGRQSSQFGKTIVPSTVHFFDSGNREGLNSLLIFLCAGNVFFFFTVFFKKMYFD